MPRTHFSADHHFGHDGIRVRCGRPWDDVASMTRGMIELWNGVVAPKDEVRYVGDFAHKCDPREVRAIFDRLHGVKHLSGTGNHDDKATLDLPWASKGDIVEIVVDGQRIVLCHYAMRVWNGQNRGAIMLYGHSHARLPDTSMSCDVGVDAWSFMPTTLPQIQRRLENKPEPERDFEPEPTGVPSP